MKPRFTVHDILIALLGSGAFCAASTVVYDHSRIASGIITTAGVLTVGAFLHHRRMRRANAEEMPAKAHVDG
jgi:hypothetical protein